MGRRCPRCQAAPGWRCGRWVGPVWTPGKTFHPERQRAKREVRYPDCTRAPVCRALAAVVLDAVAAEEFEQAFTELSRE